MKGHYLKIKDGHFDSHEALTEWARVSLHQLSQVQVAVEHDHRWSHMDQAMNRVLLELGSIYYAGEKKNRTLLVQSFVRMEKSVKELSSQGCAQLLPEESAETLVGSSF